MITMSSIEEKHQKEILEQNERIIKLLNESRPKEVQTVYVKPAPEKFTFTKILTLLVTKTRCDIDKPDAVIESPSKIPRTIRELTVSYVEQKDRSRSGLCIYMDGTKIVDHMPSADTRAALSYNVKFENGLVINPQQKITVHNWNIKERISSHSHVGILVRFGE